VRAWHYPFPANSLLDRILKDARVKTVQEDSPPARARRVVEPGNDAGVLPDGRGPPGKQPLGKRLVVQVGPRLLANRDTRKNRLPFVPSRWRSGIPHARVKRLVRLIHPAAVNITDKVEAGQARLHRHLLPESHQLAQARNVARAQEVEYRPAIDGQVSLVKEVGQQVVEVLNIVGFTGISLLLKYLVTPAVPDTGPGLVGPAEAVAMGQFRVLKQVHDRPGQELHAVAEPVMPVAQGGHPVPLGQFPLRTAGLRHAQVVESEVSWQPGLKMTVEERASRGGVRPFGEARSPPAVIFRYRVKLRKEERHYLQRGSSLSHETPPPARQRRPQARPPPFP
jgi:hypothetical protein